MSIHGLLRALRARRAGVRARNRAAAIPDIDARVLRAAQAAAPNLAEPLERRVLLTDAPAAPSFAFATWAHEAARTVSVFAGITDAAIDPSAGTGDLAATVRWTRTGGEQPVQLLDLGMPVVLTQHTYGAAGRHTAHLTVSDSVGHVIQTSVRVAAPDHAPQVGDPQLDIPTAEQQDPDSYGLTRFDSRELAPDDGLPPRVTGVYLDGSAWAQFDRDDLAALGRGSATLGYAVPAGSGQLASFPASADTIHVTFSEDVNVTQGDLTLQGLTIPQYAITGFSYDAATYSATWTLAQAPWRDRLQLDLSDSVTDLAGNHLDGEWAPAKESDPNATFPSGDGTAGGPFQFHFNVMLGDLTGEGTLDNNDLIQISPYYGAAGPDGIFHGDVNGNSIVNSRDLNALAGGFMLAVPPMPAAV